MARRVYPRAFGISRGPPRRSGRCSRPRSRLPASSVDEEDKDPTEHRLLETGDISIRPGLIPAAPATNESKAGISASQSKAAFRPAKPTCGNCVSVLSEGSIDSGAQV